MPGIEIAKKSDLDSKADINHAHSEYSPTEHNHNGVYSPESHTHSYDDLTNKPTIPDTSNLESQVSSLNGAISSLETLVEGLSGQISHLEIEVENLKKPPTE